MNLRFLASFAVLVVIAGLEPAMATNESKIVSRRKLAELPVSDIPHGHSKEGMFVSDTSVCHKIALRRCGQNFMKLFTLLDFLDGIDHYNAQCSIRKAFFACHEKLRKKPCKIKNLLNIAEEKKFATKLSEAIWSTRVCALGIQRVDELPPNRPYRKMI